MYWFPTNKVLQGCKFLEKLDSRKIENIWWKWSCGIRVQCPYISVSYHIFELLPSKSLSHPEPYKYSRNLSLIALLSPIAPFCGALVCLWWNRLIKALKKLTHGPQKDHYMHGYIQLLCSKLWTIQFFSGIHAVPILKKKDMKQMQSAENYLNFTHFIFHASLWTLTLREDAFVG